VTLGGQQTLTNKTLTDARVNKLLDTGGATVLNVFPKAGAVNNLGIGNDGAGGSPYIAGVGADANISVALAPKGTSPVQIVAGAGVTPRIGVSSPDVNTNLNLSSKGPLGVVQANSLPVGVKAPIPTNLVWGGKPGEFAADATGMYVYIGDGATHKWSGVVTGTTAGVSATEGKALSLWTGSKAQYDSIVTKSQTCIYVVTSAVATLEGMVEEVTSGVATGDISSAEPTVPDAVQGVVDAVQTGEIAAEPVADEPVTRSATTKSTRKK
jgi:hypothetical protein